MDAIARTLSRIKYRTEGTPFHVILLVGKGTQGHCHPLTVFPSLRQRPSANGYAGGFCCMKKVPYPMYYPTFMLVPRGVMPSTPKKLSPSLSAEGFRDIDYGY